MAKNILICDDAAFMRMMIKDILTKNGYSIAGEAENGAKAVEKYAETHAGGAPENHEGFSHFGILSTILWF